jgi:hypothetical protein
MTRTNNFLVQTAGVSIKISSPLDQNCARRVGLLISAQDLSDQQLTDISEEVVRTADAFWVAPLLAHRLATSGVLDDLSEPARSALRQHLCFEAGFELLTGDEVRRLGAAAHAAGIDLLLLKGAALAYLYYPAPHLRPRLDTDLLIRSEDRQRVDMVMRTLGYERSTALVADGISHQEQYTRTLRGGLVHAVDVHWKIANPLAFADLFTFDELYGSSVPVPALGQAARAPSPTHMLLLLALHRIAHHARDMDLLCMYDLHRVAAALTHEEWRAAIDQAETRAIGSILAEALDTACATCPTTIPVFVAEWVERVRQEPLAPEFARFASRDRRLGDVIASDVRMAAGWRARARLLRDHAFPPAGYMRERYGVRRSWTLPFLYARRLARGVPRVLRRGRYR